MASDLRFADLPRLRMAYRDEPAAPDVPFRGEVLLIHGFASNGAVNWANTSWVTTLTRAGWRVVAPDNRGHGRSQVFYEPAEYATDRMADDAVALLDHLGIGRPVVMGYSMGARITAFLSLGHPARVRAALLGGLGIHLVEGVGLPLGIADAMEARAVDDLSDPTQRMFRTFAEATGSDLRALAACIRGSRQVLSPAEIGRLAVPVLVSVGTADAIAGSGPELAALIPGARSLDIPGRDHNLSVGDRAHKAGVLAFLADLP